MVSKLMEGKYVIISPCRDEAEYMIRTLESVVTQTVRPSLWVIVDDGSTDQSPEILEKYAAKYSFIKIVRRDNRGFRSVGPGVVDAFYAGYREVDSEQFEYICKLDLDLDLPERYFEILIDRMAKNPRLGTCSGKPYNVTNGSLISERRGDEMSVGMTKFFRMSCFKQIGGFVREVMWDAIDCHKCRQLGWQVRSWDEPDLRFIHLRVMGSSQNGVLNGRMRHGFGQYFMGTGVIYMLVTSIFRANEYPIISGGAAMFWGYLKCFFNDTPKLADSQLRTFIRSYQLKVLVFGKDKATRIVEEKNLHLWDRDRNSLPIPVASLRD